MAVPQTPSRARRIAESARQLATVWRELAGRGADFAECLKVCVKLYRAAGGSPTNAEKDVRRIIAAYSDEEGDWLWGPAMRTAQRQGRHFELPLALTQALQARTVRAPSLVW
ncbi:hypothetical protein [Muricoccus radiodurans]|uniref:hypothetical protein n=1 Tax=Muricoccus radiodurans TaxID=2231721 RepID=UPI003CE90F5F